MRNYSIQIYNVNPDGSQGSLYTGETIAGGIPIFPLSAQDAQGNYIPGALHIELDIPIAAANTPTGSAWVRIWGIPVSMLEQSANFNGKLIVIRGGMQKGLPLADPTQQGILAQGQIFQAWGNWQGTEQTLDFQIVPGMGSKYLSAGSPIDQVPIAFSCKKNTSLALALGISLNNSYTANGNSSVNFTIQINDKIYPQNDINAYFVSLSQLAIFLNGLSKSIIKTSGYQGIQIYLANNRIVCYDGSNPSSALNPQNNLPITPKKLRYVDFIGQPSWLSTQEMAFTLSAKMVMRGDLQMGYTVSLPTAQNGALMPILNTLQSSPLVRQGLTFTGDATIISMRHVGSFRSPSADAWCTTLNMIVGVA